MMMIIIITGTCEKETKRRMITALHEHPSVIQSFVTLVTCSNNLLTMLTLIQTRFFTIMGGWVIAESSHVAPPLPPQTINK